MKKIIFGRPGWKSTIKYGRIKYSGAGLFWSLFWPAKTGSPGWPPMGRFGQGKNGNRNLEESRNQKLVSTHGPGQQVWSWGGGSSFGDGVGGRQQRRTPRSVLGRRRLPWVVCDHALRRAPLLTLPRSLSSAMPYPFSAAPCRRLGGIHIAATATGIAGHGV